MPHNSYSEDDEMDLNELFAALWSHMLFIILVTSLSIFLAAYYALTAEKNFTAESVFQIEEKDGNSGVLSGELSALASLAGFAGAGATSNTGLLLERAIGREFIINMNKKFSMDRDLYFNSYDPDYKDPLWKATIKKIIGLQKTELEKNAIIENNVLKNYRENVLFALTDGGAIKISVTHIDPQKASYYANGFMDEIGKMVKGEAQESKALRLNYLSENSS